MMVGARRPKLMALAALMGGLVLAGHAGGVRAEGPFPRLVGSWSGNGRVVLDQGKSEPISCRAYYNAKSAGADLAFAIRCASSSYKIEMRATLSQQNGQVTGQWEERTFNAAGAVSGRATDTSLNLAISGAVSGTMSVTSGEASQRIEIKTVGSGLSGVTISLARS
ncbi:MAG: hypothetical protein HC869_20000 [Rhodospirillales bacterium]|nr:hypothetical protein [Rhodospirillales bacterium]